MTQDRESMSRESYELFRSLTNITPDPATIESIEELREAAKVYADSLVTLCLPSREKSLAKTKLEESVMWAVKSLALHAPQSFEDSE